MTNGSTSITPGKGGRNQEFALAAALDIAGLEDTLILSAGTDGTDGPTDAAGAIADGTTIARAHLNADDALSGHDAYPFFAEAGDLVTIYGLPTMEGRVPTFLVNVADVPAAHVVSHLAEQGIGVWAHDSWYSLDLYKRLGYQDQAIRIGFIHYNAEEEVDRLVAGMRSAAGR